MQIEDLLDECLRIQASGGDISPLLARHPEHRAEVEALLALAQAASQLPTAKLNPTARTRMLHRLRAQIDRAGHPEVHAQVTPPGDEALLPMLASRLGATRDEIRRYFGPAGAAQVGQFLGLPGYGAMFDAMGLMVRCLRVLERHGESL